MSKKEKKKKREFSSGAKPLDKKLLAAIIISLIIGIILGTLITGKTVEQNPQLIKTYCDIDIMTLYDKPCTVEEDCYGRLELCSKQLKVCMTTVQVDKTDLRNIRIPDTEAECTANGGTWKVEIVSEEN